MAILLSRLALSQPLVIDFVKSVSYKGFTSTPASISSPGIDTFLNIPYGQDTAGRNRFAPPKAYIPHAGQVFDATIAGPSCPQSSAAPLLYQTVVTDISEDCLNLKISKPSYVADGKKLPVMVYIYGGTLQLPMRIRGIIENQAHSTLARLMTEQVNPMLLLNNLLLTVCR
jgi:hypothetical protein